MELELEKADARSWHRPLGLAVLFERLRRRLDEATAARRLNALDDRMLSDIGTARSSIDGAVRQGRKFPST